MKFWVKAIVDDDIQEQLFVDADTLCELRTELEHLLNMQLATVSIDDFQAQVVDKLNSGAEMITVKLKRVNGGSDCDVNTSRGMSEPRLSPPLTGRPRLSCSGFCDEDNNNTTNNNNNNTYDRANTSLGSAYQTSGRFMQATPEIELLSMHSLSPARSQLLDVPQLDRIWLSRDDLVVLLDRSFRGRYVSVISGCFVRIREDRGYTLFQVIGVEDGHPCNLVLDSLYTTEKRELSTVSNAQPVSAEINSWLKKVLNSPKPFPTLGFIEAKRGDVDSALGAARSALAASPPPPTPTTSAPLPPSPQVSEELGSMARRGTVYHQLSQAQLPTGRVVVKANDVMRHVHVRAITDEQGETDRLAVYATRVSNSGSKKPRRSDYAGCVWKIENNDKGGISLCSDRDVTEKGFDMLCIPVWWEGRYITLGQTQPIANDASSLRVIPETGTTVQDFALLSGDSPDSLYNPPEAVSLPIPKWAVTDNQEPKILSPMFVLHMGRLHAFYLVRTITDAPTPSKKSSYRRHRRSSREQHGGNRDTETVISSGRVTPMGVPISSALTSTSQLSTLTPTAGAGAAAATEGLAGTSVTTTLSAGAFAAPPRDKYSLCHAVTCAEDLSLSSWRCKSDRDAILHAMDAVPLFSVVSSSASLAGSFVAQSRESALGAPDSSFPSSLNVLWHAESSAPTLLTMVPPSRRRSPATLGLQMTESPSGRVVIPFQRWVNRDQHAKSTQWEHDVYYAAVQVHAERLKENVTSISLFEKDDMLFLSTVGGDTARVTVWTVPIVEEP